MEEKALATTQLDDILDEGTENAFTPIMVRIGIVHPSGKFSIEGMPEEARIRAVVLAARKNRALFPKFNATVNYGGLSGDDLNDEITEVCSGHPLCSSADGISAHFVDVEPETINASKASEAINLLKSEISKGGLKCALCPLAKWGSVTILGQNGRGMACKETRRLLLYRGTPIPMTLTVPTSSIKNWDQYCSSLAVANKKFSGVQTELSLTVQGERNIKFSTIQFAYVDNMPDEVKALLMQDVVDQNGIRVPLAKAMINQFLNTGVSIDDYDGATSGSSTGGDDF